jgi:hypothetical protein
VDFVMHIKLTKHKYVSDNSGTTAISSVQLITFISVKAAFGFSKG